MVADPVVAGGGFAAIRDFATYAKHSPDALTPAKRVYGEGISQNGRFLRDFLYQGFNADEDGRMALDGVLAHVAGAGRGSFNYRFAQPSRDAQPTSSVFFPTDIFPFTDQPETDPVSGEAGGLLDRAVAENTVSEGHPSPTRRTQRWARGRAVFTSAQMESATRAKISDNVRIYHFTGLQHFSGPFPPEKGKEKQPVSISVPAWRQGFLTLQPPRTSAAFPVLVPQVNADGNERDGVRLPEITVPLATYTGWNLRDPAIDAPDQRVAFEGSYIPFAKTAEDERSGDPRSRLRSAIRLAKSISPDIRLPRRPGLRTLDPEGRP